MLYGVLNLSLVGYVVATLIMVQITIAAVTIFLHRNQAHRALDLHPIVSHFFRLWLWLSTGMVTRQWVAIHRKHHATTDVEGDPHSPVTRGINTVVWRGAELYREAGKDKAMMEKYGFATPDDWIEHNLYSKYSASGIVIMFALDLLLFGIPGITIWAVQMLWIPFWAAGVINGIGHYWGYRNFETEDTSTNIIPIAFFIGGEELHNNHHTFASSAKFSVKWWEFDIGWMYIKILSFFGLAKVKKLPPQLAEVPGKQIVDIETVKAVFSNRFRILSNYYSDVIKPVLMEERSHASAENQGQFRRAASLLRRKEERLSQSARQRLTTLLSNASQLQKAVDLRNQLQQVWSRTATSQQEIVEALQNWCKQAEASGIDTLKTFAQRIRSYVPASAQ